MAAYAEPAGRASPLDQWLSDMAQQASSCIGPHGLFGNPKEAANLPPQQEWTGAVELHHSQRAIISDGYDYTLVVHGSSNTGYLIQAGGFSGGQRFFGPFNLSKICQPRFLE